MENDNKKCERCNKAAERQHFKDTHHGRVYYCRECGQAEKKRKAIAMAYGQFLY